MNDDGIYIYEFNNTCLEKCPEDLKIDIEKSKCVVSCDDNKFEYKNECLISCPDNTYKIFINGNKCTENKPENYYYLDNKNIYKPCFNNCLSCYGDGNESINNCIECKSDFILLSELDKKTNCFPCEFNYFIDSINNLYFCTEDSICPSNLKNLIKEKKKCINRCNEDDIYQYEYYNICLEICPNETIISDNKICYNKNETEENVAQNEITKTREVLTSGKMNFTDYYEKIGNLSIQITTSESQTNYTNYNITVIDLGKCEDELRDYYKINKTLPLIIYKVDYFPVDTLIPIIGYEVYHPINLTLLNLSICSNNTIKLYIPITIDEDSLYIHDPKSDFYTNSCHSYTTESGTDIKR